MDLAHFEYEFDGETFALLNDGAVWWIDGHAWDETVPAFSDVKGLHLATPQPFPLDGVTALASSPWGNSVVATMENGSAVTWGDWQPRDDRSPALLVTLTADAPVKSAWGTLGVLDDGSWVQWISSQVATTPNGGSVAATPLFGPKGLPAILGEGLLVDGAGQAWSFDLDGSGVATLEAFGTIESLASEQDMPFVTTVGLIDASWASAALGSLLLVGSR